MLPPVRKFLKSLAAGAVAVATLLLAAAPGAAASESAKIGGTIILATTTSTVDSGLLDALMPRFKELSGIEVKVIGIGSGAALAMAGKGDADAVLSHAPGAERKYVEQGDLIGGELIMHNDFVVLGPPADPLGARSAPSLKEALARIAARGPFISRGDDSGTHKVELALWKQAGISPADVKRREESGQGMGATLTIAGQRRGYTLSDRATYLALRKTLDLVVIREGDASMLNIYHAYVVNPAKHPGVKEAQARAFVSFMTSSETQRFIGRFRSEEFGHALFVPDAGKSLADLGRK
ncbi:MAG: substrate-binding domain-containing protein [Candidatus Sericytochromatia bacterium]|uniref:Substrate-binding domain-containing protein n=1 Tax=Candidatus Tanganyikabacteria bacterium TaxID=2961651 RepID=A0A938BHR0_9BACT|nr:substrate-binding domain-containing protein [Candidatus Tanganyikabacteria bacterium]